MDISFKGSQSNIGTQDNKLYASAAGMNFPGGNDCPPDPLDVAEDLLKKAPNATQAIYIIDLNGGDIKPQQYFNAADDMKRLLDQVEFLTENCEDDGPNMDGGIPTSENFDLKRRLAAARATEQGLRDTAIGMQKYEQDRQQTNETFPVAMPRMDVRTIVEGLKNLNEIRRAIGNIWKLAP